MGCHPSRVQMIQVCFGCRPLTPTALCALHFKVMVHLIDVHPCMRASLWARAEAPAEIGIAAKELSAALGYELCGRVEYTS